jgi:hypothetical protein
VGLEPTIPVFEREKTSHALAHEATVIGTLKLILVSMHGQILLVDFISKLIAHIPVLAGAMGNCVFPTMTSRVLEF